MSDVREAHAAALCVRPAFGQVTARERDQRMRLLLTLVVLASILLGIRVGGRLDSESASTLPPLPEAAWVVPGVVRGGEPQDSDLIALHDAGRIRGLIAVEAVSVEERAVVRSLRIPLLDIDVKERGHPSADQVLQLVRFLRTVRTGSGPGIVYVQDSTGHGAVLGAGAMIQILDGQPVETAISSIEPATRTPLDGQTVEALNQLAAVTQGHPAAAGPYAILAKQI